MSTLEKIRSEWLYSDWRASIANSHLLRITWVFCPGHAGVHGNERADGLAGKAAPNGRIMLDPPMVIARCRESLHDLEETDSHTLNTIKEKCVRGSGKKSLLRGMIRRVSNQLLMETISRKTLMWTLERRDEQLWTCAACYDSSSGSK